MQPYKIFNIVAVEIDEPFIFISLRVILILQWIYFGGGDTVLETKLMTVTHDLTIDIYKQS